ncbi:MAG: ATP-binding protein [Dehalococcoidales bacterium]|nr:ATP-binding protein [Dehalococcoidales bacterium]
MQSGEDSLLSGQRLGVVVSGSLTHGIDVRLDGSVPVEDMAVGRYVTLRGQKRRFFGMITDVTLGVADEQINATPGDSSDPFLAEVLAGTSTFATLHVLPMLTIGGTVAGLDDGPQPVKTVPSHFSPVYVSSQADVETVFGQEDEKKFFVGTPLDMETKICLDLAELVKRSNGIFGKSGTGKTFLTRMLLIGMLQKSTAVNLVFDMHNEYGWEGRSESGYKVKALKQLFPDRVAVFTLDEESSRRRKVSTDAVVRLGYDEIEPEDIVLLRQTLNLTEPAVQAAYQLARRFGDRKWIETSLSMGNDEGTRDLLESLHIHEATFGNLRRGLEAIKRLPFLSSTARENPVERILKYLDSGMNVVLEFGRYTDLTAYILVANLLSRRIYNQYRDRTEKALGEEGRPPRPLVITIEEAHKFLNHETANQTIFGTIAREMRKYNVTLLVIDQRPSGIDEEVMSQIGTKITCLLDNEKDIDAVLTGVSGKNELRSVLARLEPKQQVLIFGHAVPMPVVVRTREYGSAESYRDLGWGRGGDIAEQAARDIKDLFG